MKKIISFLLMLMCISCSSKTAVTENEYNSAVDELYGLDEISYTSYADYVDKIGDKSRVSQVDNTSTYDSNTYRARAYNGSNTYDSKTDDMIAMYYGNKNRLKWSKKELEKVVMHTFKDGHRDWFFPTFLYVEFKNDAGLKFGDNQPGDNGPANKEQWEWLLNRYFSAAYNGGNYEGLKALDECIEDCKRILGPPTFKHKVVLTVPSPCTNFTEWGSIKVYGKNVKLDFRNTSHRLEAVKWFINELVNRFNAQHYKNITLAGLYWVEESTSMTIWHKESGKWTNKRNNKFEYVVDNKTRRYNDIVSGVSNYVHSIGGLKFYWIPFSGAYGNEKWKSFGFDRCDTQTGYFWSTPDHLRNPKALKPISELKSICSAALRDGKGLEFEISSDLFAPCYGKIKKKKDIESPYDIMKVKDCTKTPNEMRASGYTRFNYNPCLFARLVNLMYVFEELGVFDRANLSYYFDNSAILNLCNSRDKEVVELVDRLARHISKRKYN